MSAFGFNVALGREVELYNRVDSNDPANSALIMVILALSGLEPDAVLKTKTTLADVLSGATNEVTNSGYARKTLTDSSLTAYTVDHTSGSITLYLPSQTFATIGAGDVWKKVLICYDSDTTAGTDANVIPIGAGDVIYNGAPISPAGGDIVIDYSGGFAIAS